MGMGSTFKGAEPDGIDPKLRSAGGTVEPRHGC